MMLFPHCIVFCLAFCNPKLTVCGQLDEAQRLLREAVVIVTAAQDREGTVTVLQQLGLVARARQAPAIPASQPGSANWRRKAIYTVIACTSGSGPQAFAPGSSILDPARCPHRSSRCAVCHRWLAAVSAVIAPELRGDPFLCGWMRGTLFGHQAAKQRFPQAPVRVPALGSQLRCGPES
jgi:hypothetical protein